MTPFTTVYDTFFTFITDDMYMETTEEETHKDCKSLLLASLPLFEFPDNVIDITQQTTSQNDVVDVFTRDLTLEEINILATGMLQPWLQRQITSVETVRQKFSGADFKMTSQASHLQRLMSLIVQTREEHRRLQMLASRRRRNGGKYESTFDLFVKKMK